MKILINKINNCYKIIRIIKYKSKFKIKMFLKNILKILQSNKMIYKMITSKIF